MTEKTEKSKPQFQFVEPDTIKQFLTLVYGTLPDRVCLQGLDDHKTGRVKRPIHVDPSDPQTYQMMENWQKDGFGVFICVNITDGLGRKTENIVSSAPVVFIDQDDGSFKALKEANYAPLGKPLFVVMRDDMRWHAYWRAETTTDLGLWSRAQRGLIAAYGSDKAIHDAPRVMRLPGTHNFKSADGKKVTADNPAVPMKVKLHLGDTQAKPIKLEDMAVGVGVVETTVGEVKPRKASGVAQVSFNRPYLRKFRQLLPVDTYEGVEAARRYLRDEAQPAVQGKHGHETAFRVGRTLPRFGVSVAQAVKLAREEYNPRCVPPWGLDEDADFRRQIERGYVSSNASGYDNFGVWHPQVLWADLDAEDVLEHMRLADDWHEPPPPQAHENVVADMNARFTLVTHGSEAKVAEWVCDPETRREGYSLISPSALRAFYQNRKCAVPIGNKTIERTHAEIWLESPLRETRDRIVFDPEFKAGPRYLNSWRGLALEPRRGSWAKLRELMFRGLCAGDQASFDYLMRMCAWRVQNPGKAVEVALIMRGEEGAGKGTFARLWKEVFGAGFKTTDDASRVLGRFNAMVDGALVIFLDEAIFAGDPRQNEALKVLVTEPELSKEHKGVDAQLIANRSWVIVSTNNEWAVPAGPIARRYFVLDVASVWSKEDAFWGELIAEMEGGGVAAFLHDLLAMQDVEHPRRGVPQTSGLTEQKLLSLKGLELVYYRALCSGLFPLGKRLHVGAAAPNPEAAFSSEIESEAGGVELWANHAMEIGPGRAKNGFVAEVTDRLKQRETMFRTPDPRVVLRTLKIMGAEYKKRMDGGYWVVPPLPLARQAFERWLGSEVSWDGGDSGLTGDDSGLTVTRFQ